MEAPLGKKCSSFYVWSNETTCRHDLVQYHQQRHREIMLAAERTIDVGGSLLEMRRVDLDALSSTLDSRAFAWGRL